MSQLRAGRSLRTFGDSSYNGVRGAAQSFEHTINEMLTQNGLKQGACSPCVIHSKEHKVGVMHHGDDFVAVGPRRTTPKEHGLHSEGPGSTGTTAGRLEADQGAEPHFDLEG
eukprot:2841018-Amphidinium_carterae.1